ncbi:unnamed protein product [Brachionus calyciflorus]|uniref:Uncharacterized protein n=1 Tax=Brachionus calyciflorus TaxID=104777 RepID=A0A813TZU7_9BILA|nr:unnamed protein product [Brachionus calyciflorus]
MAFPYKKKFNYILSDKSQPIISKYKKKKILDDYKFSPDDQNVNVTANSIQNSNYNPSNSKDLIFNELEYRTQIYIDDDFEKNGESNEFVKDDPLENELGMNVESDNLIDFFNDSTEITSTDFDDSFEKEFSEKTEEVYNENNIYETFELVYEKFTNSDLDLAAALLCLFYSGNLTQQSFKIVCELIKVVTKNGENEFKIPSDINQCLKWVLDKNIIEHEINWLCLNCKSYKNEIKNKHQGLCQVCGQKLQCDFKVSIVEQLKRIFAKNKNLINFSKDSNEDYLEDVYDGEIYRKIKNIEKCKFFTFLLNTDGVQMCSKSDLSVWPIILVINEIPINQRFNFDNVIIAGLCVSFGKPTLGFLLNSIKNELLILEKGTFLNENQYLKTNFFLISAVFDKPARSSVLNMVASTGYFSCLKCIQEGLRVETENGGTVQTFPVKQVDFELLKRSKELYESHLGECLATGKSVFGIKDKCILNDLKYFHPIENTIIDTMHSISLGVIKTLFVYWFESPISYSYSLKCHVRIIDERLKLIKPPSYVSIAPRSIFLWKIWRSKEFLNYILLYSLIVLYEVMSIEHYNNLILLVLILEFFYSPKIKKSDLPKMKSIIMLFLNDLDELYDQKILKSGFHELIHYPDMVLNFGPINCSNCYPFEELNRKITSLIKGQNLVGQEFLKIFNIIHFLSGFKDRTDNEYFRDFFEKYSIVKSSNTRLLNSSLLKISERKSIKKDRKLSSVFMEEFKIFLEEFVVVDHITYKGHRFSNKQSLARFNDCYVSITNKEIYGLRILIMSQKHINKPTSSGQTYGGKSLITITGPKTAQRQVLRSSDINCVSNDSVSPKVPSKYAKNNSNKTNSNFVVDENNSENALKKNIANVPNANITKLTCDKTDYALIKFDEECEFDIVKVTRLNYEKISSIQIGKNYSIQYSAKWYIAKVLYIGSLQSCRGEFSKISEYKNINSNSTNSVKKNNSISTDEILKITSSDTMNDSNNSKIADLERALLDKEIYIKNLETQLNKQKEQNESLKNTFNKDQIKKFKDLCVNFMRIFGDQFDFSNIPLLNCNEEGEYYVLSNNYPEIKIKKEFKNKLEAYVSSPNETPLAAFRKVISNLIKNLETWAINTRLSMLVTFSKELNASYEYVINFKPGWSFALAEAEITKMCSERRRDLKKLGYVFSNEKDERGLYEIVRKPQEYSYNDDNINNQNVEIEKKSNENHMDEQSDGSDNDNDDLGLELRDDDDDDEIIYSSRKRKSVLSNLED